MLEIIILLVVAGAFFLGYESGKASATKAASELVKALGVSQRQMKAAARRLGLDIDTSIEMEADDGSTVNVENTVEIKIEKHQDILFAYTINDEFIAQHKDPTELVDLICSRMPKNTLVNCDLENGGNYLEPVDKAPK
jgi:hypothetical protein